MPKRKNELIAFSKYLAIVSRRDRLSTAPSEEGARRIFNEAREQRASKNRNS